MNSLNLIPTPQKTTMNDSKGSSRIAIVPHYTAVHSFSDAASTLVEYARRTHGIVLTEGSGGIVFEKDNTLPSEGYTITVSSGKVTVRAADIEGAHHAAVTLIQLMKKDAEVFTLPVGELEDYPRCSWRAVMIDLARDWHELHVLYEYVDMCCFYKLRYLHLHFTDDQSYTLPSKAFPKLSTEGRHYTEEELKGLIAYAKSRGVQIVPEIDVPGHASSFCSSYGNIFGTNGIISQSEESMEAMSTLFSELCELFSDSDYIHIGGDEADIDSWTRCDKSLSAYRNAGTDVDKYLENDATRHELAELMYATFIKRICEVVLSCGKTPVVWEGFHESMNHLIPRKAVIVSWENYYQTTPQLLNSGFRIINGAWVPLYIVTPVHHLSPEEVYNWTVYSWGAVHPDSPYLNEGLEIEPTMQVEGAQILAWGDHIMKHYPNVAEGVREEQRLVEERCVCLTENVWHRIKPLTWDEFKPKTESFNALYTAFCNGK